MFQALRSCQLHVLYGQLKPVPLRKISIPFSSIATRFSENSLLEKRINDVMQQTRYYDKCKREPVKTCGSSSIAKNPCGRSKKREKKSKKGKSKDKQTGLKSMWDIPDCPPRDIVCSLPVRYDVLHYRISDKSKQKYQQTWIECPKLMVKPKKICVYDQVCMPKIKRRKRPYKNETACKMQTPMPCPKPGGSKRCPFVVMPCCKQGRRPPTCLITPTKSNCKKKKTPYPSYSECKKSELDALPPEECKCLDIPALCDGWAELRRRMSLGLKPKSKCP